MLQMGGAAQYQLGCNRWGGYGCIYRAGIIILVVEFRGLRNCAGDAGLVRKAVVRAELA
jgi:hypothetical protein